MAAGLRNVLLSFCLIALGGLLFGYMIGINSNVVTKGQLICPDDWTGDVGNWTSWGYGQCYHFSDWGQGILSSMNLIGATLSSLICFQYADDLGRKREVQIGAALYLAGSLGAALSPVLWGIYAGLLVYGLGIGFAMHAAPVYIAEISPAEVRGTLVSAKEAVIVLGIFGGFASGAAFAAIPQDGWRLMVGLAGALALVMECGIVFVPNSPRWLLLQSVRRAALLGSDSRCEEEARAGLRFFRRGAPAEEVETELQAIRDDAAASLGQGQAGCCQAFRYPKPLRIGWGLVLLQQVTGQPSVLYFATNIFKGAGFKSTAALSSVGVGFVKLVATLFTVFRVDRYGRRVLLLSGIAMMAVALLVLGTAFLFRECAEPVSRVADCEQDDVRLPQGWAICTVAALMLYVSGYQVGFGPISWLMISEIFPLNVRGAALSTAAVVNFSSNITMTLCQTALMSALTPAGLFYAYLVLTVVSFGFVKVAVPETKGKTLEEIEVLMTGKRRNAPSGNIQVA
mmetsp:Transcript_37337/g.104823  ORF Transcript_37337/g.104823 Transcript_37337/m.104823 type:complete len:512 (-) Transcript_37337:231-1766(-)